MTGDIMNQDPPAECVGSCGWNKAEGVGCDSGGGSCWAVALLAANISDFHDQVLADATQEIKSIVAKIPPRSGYKLSFVHTNMGTLLTWVHHGRKIPHDAIRYGDDDAKIAEALGLILDKQETSQAY